MYILSAGGQDCILEPLCFPEQLNASITISSTDEGCMVCCVLCSHMAPLSDKDQLLKHLLLEHKLVIADIRLIADFQKYNHKNFSDSALGQVFQMNRNIKVESVRGYGYEYFNELVKVDSAVLHHSPV